MGSMQCRGRPSLGIEDRTQQAVAQHGWHRLVACRCCPDYRASILNPTHCLLETAPQGPAIETLEASR